MIPLILKSQKSDKVVNSGMFDSLGFTTLYIYIYYDRLCGYFWKPGFPRLSPFRWQSWTAGFFSWCPITKPILSLKTVSFRCPKSYAFPFSNTPKVCIYICICMYIIIIIYIYISQPSAARQCFRWHCGGFCLTHSEGPSGGRGPSAPGDKDC